MLPAPPTMAARRSRDSTTCLVVVLSTLALASSSPAVSSTQLAPEAAASCPATPRTDTCLQGGNAYNPPANKGYTVDSCCAACVADAPACYGFELNQAGSCRLYSAWSNATKHCKGTTLGPVANWPPIPPSPTPVSPPEGARNVLFLVTDDMRPSLGGAYGLAEASTPSIDKLASEGRPFLRAYVNFAYCAPSRNSFMSGRRPDATRVYNFVDHFREPTTGAEWSSLPELFKNNGYTTFGTGKTFDQPRSWSPEYPYYEAPNRPGQNECPEECCGVSKANQAWYCKWRVKPGGNNWLQDQNATYVLQQRMREAAAKYKSDGTPFFAALGLHKPHLRWDFPEEYWDKIPDNVTVTKEIAFPKGTPRLHFHDCAEMSWPFYGADGSGAAPPPPEWSQEMRHAYYACIAYADDLFGQTLDLLDELGLENDTVVALVADHGWHLQEHDMWCKMSVFELGTRIPFVIRAPWVHAAGTEGQPTRAIAEIVDLMPTLADLAGVPLPTGAAGAHIGGVSQRAAIENPSDESTKQVALSQFPRCWQNNTHHDPNQYGGAGDETNHTVSWESMSDCHWTRRADLDYMGYSIRTDQYRFTQWFVWDGEALMPKWDQVVGTELYDHSEDTSTAPDMDQFENVNLADDPSRSATVAQLAAQLKAEVLKWAVPYTPEPVPPPPSG